MDRQPLRVLFLCTGNSARSQLAETLARELGRGRIAAFSAGTAPQGVNPLTELALAEVGLSCRGQASKHLDTFAGQRFDYVISVCDNAAEACPVWPGGGTRLHWPFADPAAAAGDDTQRLATFRDVREQIATRLKAWLTELEDANLIPKEQYHG